MNIKDFKVANRYLVVKHKKEELIHKSESGIYFAERTKWEDLMKGTVEGMSDDVKLPSDISIGSHVYFYEKNVKSRFRLNSVEYLNVKDEDLIAYEEKKS
jgi:co-chaperonin GroES (HSP10)